MYLISILLLMIRLLFRWMKLLNQKLKQKTNSINNTFRMADLKVIYVSWNINSWTQWVNLFRWRFFFLWNLAKKLNNPLLQTKTYRSILKNLRQIPVIPPLLEDNKFVTDIQTMANIFNTFFAEQSTPLINGKCASNSSNVFKSIKTTFFRFQWRQNP